MNTHNIWATSLENLFMPYVTNKGTDQPAHPRSLISAFVVHCLDSIIPLVSISSFKPLAGLCSCAGRFGSTLVANDEDRFSRDEAHMFLWRIVDNYPFIIVKYPPYLFLWVESISEGLLLRMFIH